MQKNRTFLETIHYLYSCIDPDKIFNKIFSSLAVEEIAWISHWEKELQEMLQTHFFSRQNLERFIHRSLLPLKEPLENLYNHSTSRAFRHLIEKEKQLWLDFLLTHPLENITIYINNVSIVYDHVAHLLVSTAPAPEMLQIIKEEGLAFAKDHTPEELKRALNEVTCIDWQGQHQQR
jgi:hypothetical protein